MTMLVRRGLAGVDNSAKFVRLTLETPINNAEALKNYFADRFGNTFSLAGINQTALDDLENREQYTVFGFIIGMNNGTLMKYSCYTRFAGNGPSGGYAYIGQFNSGYVTRFHAGDILDIALYTNPESEGA